MASGLTGGRESLMPRSKVFKLRIYPSHGQGFVCALCSAKLKHHIILSNELGSSPANWSHSPAKSIRQVITECRRSRSVESPLGIFHSVTPRPSMGTSVHRRTPATGSHRSSVNHVLLSAFRAKPRLLCAFVKSGLISSARR